MKVLLLKEVQGIGHAGDIKEVSEGHARNFLIPRGLASIVNKDNLSVLEAKKNKQEKTAEKERKEKMKLVKKIDGQSFEIKASADEKGNLYAKIGAKNIVSELKNQGVSINEKEIKLSEAIRKIGRHKISLGIAGENVNIFVEVKSKDNQ